jgi:hypothetical protein
MHGRSIAHAARGFANEIRERGGRGHFNDDQIKCVKVIQRGSLSKEDQ